MARNTSVTLGEHFEKYVASKIAEGRYQSVSEVVREGLRKLEESETRLEALRAKLEAGEQSGLAVNFDRSSFLQDMRKRHLK